jgi:hypothetical protein
MAKAIRLLRMVRFVILGSILLCALAGEFGGPKAGIVNPSLSHFFTTVGVSIVGVIFVVRRSLVLRPAETLSLRPDDTITLNHWKTGYLVTYVLCEILAMSGIVLRFLGFSFQQSVPYYLGGFMLLLFFRPRVPPIAP